MSHGTLMDRWRDDLRQSRYFAAALPESHYKRTGHHITKREQDEFTRRVMNRLRQRGWLLKECAYFFNLSMPTAVRICGRKR